MTQNPNIKMKADEEKAVLTAVDTQVLSDKGTSINQPTVNCCDDYTGSLATMTESVNKGAKPSHE